MADSPYLPGLREGTRRGKEPVDFDGALMNGDPLMFDSLPATLEASPPSAGVRAPGEEALLCLAILVLRSIVDMSRLFDDTGPCSIPIDEAGDAASPSPEIEIFGRMVGMRIGFLGFSSAVGGRELEGESSCEF